MEVECESEKSVAPMSNMLSRLTMEKIAEKNPYIGDAEALKLVVKNFRQNNLSFT